MSCMKAMCKQGKKSSNERLEEREIIMMKSREVTWWYEGLESEFPENVSCLCLVFFYFDSLV